MVNSTFDPKETELERTVVISEREGNENEPLFRLNEAINRSAFETHPYRNQVIGDMADLKKMTRDDLYQHYQGHYSPNNAVIAIAGDFETNAVIDRINQLYRDIPAKQNNISIPQPEGAIQGLKKVDLEGPGDTTYLQVTYRAPAAKDTDFFALMVLDSLLTGPSTLAMFGGGSVSNKTSRLYQRLVEKDKAVAISGGLQATADPYLHDILAILPPGKSIDETLKIIDNEIERMQSKIVDESEITRAIKQAKALFAYGSENITNQAFWMGYASMFADYSWFEDYIAKIEKISREDLQESAQKYLNSDQRVIGIYRPKNNGK
jgi:zinc protease